MLQGAFFFAVMALSAKKLYGHITVMEILFFRSIIGFVLIIPFLMINKASFKGHNISILVWRSLFGSVALYMFFFAISRLDLASAVMLNYTSPIFTTLLAGILLKEHLNVKICALILLSFVGVGLIMQPKFHIDASSGALAGLLSGALAGCAYICIRYLRKSDSPFTVIYYFTGICTLFSLPSLFLGEITIKAEILPALLGVGIGGHLGQLNMTRAYMLSPAAIIANFAYFTVLFSALFGIFFLQEAFEYTTALGSLLIITSGILITRMKHYRNESGSQNKN